MGVGDAGDGVGHAGTGGDQRDADLPGHLRMGLRHVDRRALVADVDDLDALGIEAHEQRHDVAAAQGEDPLDARALSDFATSAATLSEDICTGPNLFVGAQPSHATRAETVRTEKRCETRIAPR